MDHIIDNDWYQSDEYDGFTNITDNIIEITHKEIYINYVCVI